MIAVVAPYARGETTWAALRIANVLVGAGVTVTYLTYGSVGRKIHAYWDGRVLAAARFRNITRLNRASHIINFGFPPELLGNDKSQRIFVPSSYPIPDDKVRLWLKPYHRVICPSQHSCRKYANLIDGREERLAASLWTSEAQFTRREGPLQGNRIRVCVHCDPATINGSSQFTLALVRELLDRYAHLDITLLSEKTWTRGERQEQQQLRKHFKASRLTFIRQTVPFLWNDIYLKHDWLIVPSARSDFGAPAVQGLACGVPVIAPQMAPFDEIVRHQYNGLLVPCETMDLTLRHPLAVPTLGNWLETCDRALANHKLLLRLQINDWEHNRFRREFDETWCRWLEIV